MKFPKTFSDDKKQVNVIIETPYGSRNKLDYDTETGLFKLKKVLPAGLSFPCDMGFIPHTKGEDGDPLDALVFMNELIFPGNWVMCCLLGVIKATQKERGKKAVRNDRFLMFAAEECEYETMRDIKDIAKSKLEAITDFFKDYNRFEKREFKVIGYGNRKEAKALIKDQLQ